MRFSLGLLSSTQGIETLREDEVTVATYIKSKLSPRDAVQFDKLHNDLKDGVQNNFTSFLTFCFILILFIFICTYKCINSCINLVLSLATQESYKHSNISTEYGPVDGTNKGQDLFISRYEIGIKSNCIN